MRTRAVLPLAFVLATISCVASSSAAQTSVTLLQRPYDPAPHAPQALDVRHQIAFAEDLSSLQLQALIDVYKAQARPGVSVSAQELRDGGPAARSLFEEQTRTDFEGMMRRTFGEDALRSVSIQIVYGRSDGDGDFHRPPIQVTLGGEVALDAKSIGLPALEGVSTRELVQGLQRSGAVFAMDYRLDVPAGVRMSLNVTTPDRLVLTDQDAVDQPQLHVERDNWNPRPGVALVLGGTLRLRDDLIPASLDDGPSVDLTLLVNETANVTHRFAASLAFHIEVPSLRVADLVPSPLSQSVDLEWLSADLLRVAVRARLVSPEDLEAQFQRLVATNLQAVFGIPINATMDSGAFAQSLGSPLARNGSLQPLVFDGTTSIPLSQEGALASSGVARTINMVIGAKSSLPLANPGPWPIRLAVLYPEGVRVQATDTLERVDSVARHGREGFAIRLAPGESTRIDTYVTTAWDTGLVAAATAQLLGLALAGVGAQQGVRRLRTWCAARRS